ncbi:unnamed protein product [Cyprideis torosa]|uniref:PH domain-containing protein n=1 Tax=Cyprideis torosa TaxID=163714 RepID=A0A7R8ZQA4_9CRUS|nr:unnamed protein product [Cyprideis torosa]CAG0891626.1 unnamed protein product [Cyprideis torosa]
MHSSFALNLFLFVFEVPAEEYRVVTSSSRRSIESGSMSVNFNDVLKEGYCNVKRRKFGLWQRRYLVLRCASSTGPCRLERYDNPKNVPKRTPVNKAIMLSEVQSIDIDCMAHRMLHASQHPSSHYAIILHLRDGTTRTLTMGTDQEVQDWNALLMKHHPEAVDRYNTLYPEEASASSETQHHSPTRRIKNTFNRIIHKSDKSGVGIALEGTGIIEKLQPSRLAQEERHLLDLSGQESFRTVLLNLDRIDNPDYTAYLEDDDGESEEKIVDKVDHSVLYNVYLMPSLITDICGECCLQVARQEIGLYDVEEKRLKLLHWPIECIMKYGVDSKKLVMQVNNNCLTGKGVFWFETTELKPVFGALYYTAEYWRRRNKRLWEKKKQRDMTFDKTPRRFPLRLHRPKMSIENVIEHAMEPPKSVQPPPRIRKISTEGMSHPLNSEGFIRYDHGSKERQLSHLFQHNTNRKTLDFDEIIKILHEGNEAAEIRSSGPPTTFCYKHFYCFKRYKHAFCDHNVHYCQCKPGWEWHQTLKKCSIKAETQPTTGGTPEEGTSTPDGAIPSTPDGGTSTPDGGNSTPNGGSSTPDEVTPTPDGGSSTPDEVTPTPDGGSSTPDEVTPTPNEGNEGTTNPDEGTPTRDEGTPTPDERTPTPDERTPTPDEGTPTPDEETSTPDEETSTPDEGTPTPDEGTPTPDERTPTPDEGTSTPDEGTNTPDEGTPTPTLDEKTPTPDEGTRPPTPDEVTPTPDEGTPNPDEGTPTRDEGTPTPDEGTPTLDERTPTPDEGTPNPDEGTPTRDEGTTPTPDEGTPALDERTPTPDEGTPNPDEGTPTLDERTPTPDEGTPNPDEGTPTRDEGTPTPDEGTPTPDEGTPTLDERTPTPDEGTRTPTPDEGTPNPDEGTPTLDERTPTPDEGTPTRDEETPTPEGLLL